MISRAEGAWVTGLTGAVRIITVGQSYVAEGQKVLLRQYARKIDSALRVNTPGARCWSAR